MRKATMRLVALQMWAVMLLRIGDGGPIRDLDAPEDVAFFDEQDPILQNLLKALNISEVPVQEPAKVEPPEYMLELFHRFTLDKSSMPSANIVRSFKNEEHLWRPVSSPGTRRYPLLFNVSIPDFEKITLAELRLFTLVEQDWALYDSLGGKVTILEVLDPFHQGGGVEGGDDRKRRVLASRHTFGTDNEWKTFEVTEAVRKAHRLHASLLRLEVQIENRGRGGGEPDKRAEINLDLEAKHEPLLIVFSDDRSQATKEAQHQLNEMMDHERMQELTMTEEEDLLQVRSNLIYDSTSRRRRNAKGGGGCKKVSLHVDFKEIGWDSWIIAPLHYDAFQCRGACAFPLDGPPSTTHAMARALLRLGDPDRAAPVCCVPTRLAPISLLYLEKGVVTFKTKYEDMVVAECGCR
ncbi:bone morphogenetic protein 10 [Anolis sagrei]|uniref:bone morphogenetic protein 10 n=1 Tax=Anolis sagrei TaxID=38937 RepID=UPI00352104AF